MQISASEKSEDNFSKLVMTNTPKSLGDDMGHPLVLMSKNISYFLNDIPFQGNNEKMFSNLNEMQANNQEPDKSNLETFRLSIKYQIFQEGKFNSSKTLKACEKFA